MRLRVGRVLFQIWALLTIFQIFPARSQNTDLKFEHITSAQGLPQSTIGGIVKDKYGFMWFGTWAGLCRYDGYEFKVYRNGRNDPHSLNSNRIHHIVKDADQNLWVLTFNTSELCKYNYEKDNFERIPERKVSNDLLVKLKRKRHLQTTKITYGNYRWGLDSLSDILVGVNLKTGKRKFYEVSAANPWSINSTHVSDLYKDNHNILWVGTSRNGLNKANLNAKPFEYYFHDPFTSQSLIDNNVDAICEDKQGRLWVGTRDDGITIIDKTKYQHIVKNQDKTIVANHIRVLFCDSRGIMWIGTKRGLNSFDPSTGRFEHFTKLGLENLSVYAIYEDNDQNIWFGTWNGLYRYSIRTNKWIHIDPDRTEPYKWVRSIIQDRKGQIWAAMEGAGISVLKRNPRTDSFVLVKKFSGGHSRNSINDKRVYCLHEDREGLIWIGTGNGLNIYNGQKDSIIQLSRKTRLSDASIAAITEDPKGFIWLSHTNGISRINKRNLDMQHYTYMDGLQGNEFYEGSVFNSKRTGKLYFGGNNGMTAFNPDLIKSEKTLPNTVLTELQILNHKVELNEKVNGRVVLTKPLYLTKDVELIHEDKSISLEFAGLHYSNPQGNLYAYKLEGFDKDWIYTDASRRIASYSNLEPGEYVFKVISSNSDGLWNRTPATLRIVVRPPFWASTWAYILYAILLGAAFYIYDYYSRRFSRLQAQLSYESLIRQKENELHENKLEFFTNISHEIKTPLTLILAPLEKLVQMFSGNQTVSSQLSTMKSNGDRLLNLINELLDFRKLDTTNTELDLKRQDIVNFLKKQTEYFKPSAAAKNIDFKFIFSPSSFLMTYDEDKLEKVMSNLLSNALKFTPDYGQISICFSLKKSGADELIVIEVANSGSFIPKEETEKIFEPFQQGTGRKAGGTGIGLAFSKGLVKLHGGSIHVNSIQKEEGFQQTSFIIELPANTNDESLGAHLLTDIPSPLVIAEAGAVTESELVSSPIAEDKVLVSGKIPLLLIVDDNDELRQYLGQHFRSYYNILEAENGAKALEIALRELPDLIISDVMMPELDGFEFCKRVKSDTKIGHIPVILLTARSPENDKIEGLETGADDYIVKPFNVAYLNARVRNLLMSREKLKEKYRQTIALSVAPEEVPLSADEKLLKKMMQVIETRLSDPSLVADDICEEIGVSRSSLYRKVKSLTGLSILDIIKELRLKRAKQLLQEEKFNVNEVTFMVGFTDSVYFRKCFKTEFGLSPTEYKKLHHNEANDED